MKAYIDTETCGLVGPAVLIQWGFENSDEVFLHNFWTNKISKSLELIETLTTYDFVGFNIVFDIYQINKIYNMLALTKERHGDVFPENYIDEIAELEQEALNGKCVKFARCMDLLSWAKTTKYQMTMERSDIMVRRVPNALAYLLRKELEERVQLPNILFARQKVKKESLWDIQNIEDKEGNVNPDFVNLVLKFKPSAALKDLMSFIKGKEMVKHDDISISKHLYPLEYGYAPFAKAVSNASRKWEAKIKMKNQWKEGWAWPGVIAAHISHWENDTKARQYASDDIVYTKELEAHFDCPEPGDTNSELCGCVGAVRVKGFALNIPGLQKLFEDTVALSTKYPTKPRQSREYLWEVLSPSERVAMGKSTKKTVLEDMAKWDDQECICITVPKLAKFCTLCDKTGKVTHPVSQRAKNILESRKAEKQLGLFEKLLRAGRFHASFRIIGALSSRMSGSDGLNPQGINKVKTIRKNFPLADPDMELWGGDFDAFEIAIAVAVYNDEKLRADLLTMRPCHKCAGNGKANGETCKECGGSGEVDTKIHALFGRHVYPGFTYEMILASSGTNDDKYTRSKSAVFAMLYGGVAHTLKERLGVPIEVAEKAYQLFTREYPGVGIAREKIIESFSALTQPNGLGSAIYWKEPAEKISSLLGFSRYFGIENSIIRALFSLAQSPPKEWRDIKIKVKRRERLQTAGGAAQSALYGSAFSQQSSNIRAAQNHVIQSTGAQITKEVQRAIWDYQPVGVHEWLVQPMNIHDEVMCAVKPGHGPAIKKIVDDKVSAFKEIVPMIKMTWSQLETWASK